MESSPHPWPDRADRTAGLSLQESGRRLLDSWLTSKIRDVMSEALKIVVVGRGYVGLPLAVPLGAHSEVIGFDVDKRRIDELLRGHITGRARSRPMRLP